MTSRPGRPDFDVGDLVVCIDDAPCPTHGPTGLSKGTVYSVVEVRYFKGDVDFEPDWAVALLNYPRYFSACLFRRVDPRPPEFWAGTIDADVTADDTVPA